MADELQALLDRINKDGLQKADQKREELLRQAQDEAERLIDEAKDKARKLVDNARGEADLLLEKGKESLRQAARDVILSLREQLQQRVSAVAKACMAEALSPETVSAIVQDLASAYMEKRGAVDKLELLVGEEQLDALESAVKAKLNEDLRESCELRPVANVGGGFKLVFNDEDVVYDFSEESLAEAVARFVNPKLSDIVLGK